LIVRLVLAPQKGRDLRTITRQDLRCDLRTLRDVTIAGHQAIRFEGTCDPNGPLASVLVVAGPDRVLLLYAMPLESVRIADFERLIASLTFV
jgi:hypothetical protein